MHSTITLYRPATPQQLQAVAALAWAGFDAHSLCSGYFYPMLHRDYARLLARRWNAREYGEGFVLGFAVDTGWLAQFRPQTVATARQLEYRIPAARLAEFNRQLRGPIRLLERYGQRPLAVPLPRTSAPAWDLACAV